MVRRVWGVRGLKVVQRLQLAYKWKYLFLVVDYASREVGVDMDGLYEFGDGVSRGVVSEATYRRESAGMGRSGKP